MKKSTEKRIEYIDTNIFSRVVIDRKMKKDTAILEHKRQIIKDVNVTAAYLYDYYVSICQIPTWDLTDDAKIAKQIGLSPRQVMENRRKLTEAKWIRFEVLTNKGRRVGTWFIGKDVVNARITNTTTIEELHDLGILLDDEYEKVKGYVYEH